jgi:hypothetical protein
VILCKGTEHDQIKQYITQYKGDETAQVALEELRDLNGEIPRINMLYENMKSVSIIVTFIL